MEIRAKTAEDQELLLAAANGNMSVLQQATDRQLRTVVCTSGCTCLHWAAGCNQLAVVSYLVDERKIPVDLPAVKKSRDRTALHYACRNGHLTTVQWLVQVGKADSDARAKHGVSPFQLAVWQNRLDICQWLVEECEVDAAQLNDFACGAVHWIGLCPRTKLGAEEEEEDLLPMAKWLDAQTGVDFRRKQRQGHSPLHKAAWGGHLSLIKYLHEYQDLWDDSQDDAGNFAADLADMANTPHHSKIAAYLRQHCSRARAESCAILRIPVSATENEIRKAYLKQARELHPDKQTDYLLHESSVTSTLDHEFDALHKAYRHLIDEKGHGNQSNPNHSLNLMLEHLGDGTEQCNREKDDDTTLFKARLISVLLEYGDKGLDLSNVKKKWGQVWPDEPFPDYATDPNDSSSNKKRSLSDFLMEHAGDVIDLVKDLSGCVRVHSKHNTQASIAKHATR